MIVRNLFFLKYPFQDLPTLGVSPWQASAEDAGFELRECENPTDVCASYCVAVPEVRGH